MATAKRKALPAFASEEQERAFWASHDSSEYVDWAQSERRTFPNLKPTLRTISLRLPETMIGQFLKIPGCLLRGHHEGHGRGIGSND